MIAAVAALSGAGIYAISNRQVSKPNVSGGNGQKIIKKIGEKENSLVLVSPTHEIVRLIFGDGRELLASLGHPTVDGRAVGDLTPAIYTIMLP